jgi:ferrous iron transport protein B
VKKIVIAGNPNSGKTCLFNLMTGNIQRVGNYPGVTVEFSIGSTKLEGEKVEVIDLPGTYSLTAYSQEEVVARNYIIDEQPDLIINVVDASNLERNLYLTAQLIELNIPMIIALNMVDVAEKKGIKIDAELLGQLLGVRVAQTVGSRRRGLEGLKQKSLETITDQMRPKPLPYSHEMRQVLPALESAVAKCPWLSGHFSARWAAVKLLEDDEIIVKRLKDNPAGKKVVEELKRAKNWLRHHSGEDSATAVVEARYGIATGAAREVTMISEINRRMLTDVIDRFVCNRYFGPIFLCMVVYTLFLFVFKCSDDLKWVWLPSRMHSPTEVFNLFFEEMAVLANGIPIPWLRSMVADGIIGGVGGVMGFVPLIFFMFLFIAVLEDSGYIARVAFIMDRVLRIFGLQGKSVLALIVSGGLGAGGCAVPGVMAARTLREEKDRLITIMVAPFMNCGAKMPVYAMLIAAFFAKSRGLMMFLLWIISWIFALCSAWALRKWVVKGEQTPFVMELPVYHMPTLRGILMDTWLRTWMYVQKAGTIILGVSIIMWVLMYYPRYESPELEAKLKTAQGNRELVNSIKSKMANQQLKNSWAGRVGCSIEPVSAAAGFSWRENIALIGGLAAKEVVLGTMGTAYSMDNIDPDVTEPLSQRLSSDPDWNPLRGFVLLLFVVGYAPCLATLAAIKKETGSWKWTAFSAIYSTVVAFIVCVAVYQVGMLFGC